MADGVRDGSGVTVGVPVGSAASGLDDGCGVGALTVAEATGDGEPPAPGVPCPPGPNTEPTLVGVMVTTGGAVGVRVAARPARSGTENGNS